MILLKKIQLKDFLSHKDTTLDFSDEEKLLLDGASGAGKSSIFDAIIWCLYGVSRADNRSLIRRGTKMAQVTLQLKKDDNIVTIKRTVTSIGKHNLVVTTAQEGSFTVPFVTSGVREIQNWIEKDLIGASYLLFINSVAYVQGNADSFVMQTAAKRKELLLEIVKSEDYSKYYENARLALSGLGNDENMASGKIIELEAHLASLTGLISTRGEHIKTLTTNTGLINALEPQIQTLEVEKSKIMAESQNITNLDSALKNAISDVNSTQQDIDKKLEKIGKKDELVKKLSTAQVHKKDAATSTKKLLLLRKDLIDSSEIENKRNIALSTKPIIHDVYYGDIESIQKEIIKIQSNPVCPSGEKCPYSGDHGKKIEKLKDNIKDIEKTMELEASQLQKWTEEFNKLPLAQNLSDIIKKIGILESSIKESESELSKAELIQKDIDLIKEIEADMPGLNATLEDKKTRLIVAKRNRESAEQSTNNEEIKRVMDGLADMKHKKELIRESITRATAALENIDKNEEEVKIVTSKVLSLKKELSDISEKKRKVELIKTAFGRGGIESLVIDYLIPRLEDKINEILLKLSDFKIRLDTQKKSVDGETNIEGLYIFCSNEMGEEMDFSNYSGGEKLKINVAISEALASLSKSIGFRIMDETIVGLSPEMVQEFVSVLNVLQRQYSQVLVVSHLLEIKSMFENVIIINKHNGISTIKKQ